MAREAGTAALNDAGISYQDVEAVVASYCYGEPTSGVIVILLKKSYFSWSQFFFFRVVLSTVYVKVSVTQTSLFIKSYKNT